MRIESMDASWSTKMNTSAQIKTDLPAKSAEHEKHDYGKTEEYTTDVIGKAFLENAVKKANETLKIQNRSLEFQIHERTNEVMVKVIDKDTKEVIREIPPEKLLDMFANMLELAGLLVDERR